MQIAHWDTPITSTWKRALDLKDLRPSHGALLVNIEEESGRAWSLEFKPVQAWKVTTEECAGNIIAELPDKGALFIVRDSDWLHQLGNATPLEKSQHFLICCYDEIIEVIAWDCKVITGQNELNTVRTS